MKIFILFIAFIVLHSGCGNSHKSGRISITVSESEEMFRISAGYDLERQDGVAAVLDQYLTGRNDPSFKNTILDAEMSLSDKTNFYIKFVPGKLDLEASKLKNKRAAIDKLRKMAKALGEAIK